MRAVIDWSYALLSSQARVLFARLAICTGGFTLENVAAIAMSIPTMPYMLPPREVSGELRPRKAMMKQIEAIRYRKAE